MPLACNLSDQDIDISAVFHLRLAALKDIS